MRKKKKKKKTFNCRDNFQGRSVCLALKFLGRFYKARAPYRKNANVIIKKMFGLLK